MLREYKQYIDKSGFQKLIWPEADIPILNAVRDVCQWVSGITIKIAEGEYFGFSIRKQNKDQILNTLLQHLESLEKFCIYFSEHATPLRKAVHRMHDKYQAQANLDSVLNIKNNSTDDATRKFHNRIIIDKINRGNQNKYAIKITPRQLSVLRLLFKGYTAKEIANALNLSFRTVESHISILKYNFNCTRKSELIRYLTKLSYDKYFLD
ncbi:MAG: LuxR family transcriptional regulator [Legionellaceae bacterium]|nr:LuxR family transcriptional regulator [Legionellaceae bacterium]